MREPRNYDALRDTERKILAEQKFVEAGREATVPIERPAPVVERQAEAPEQPFMTPEDRHEAARAALWAELDSKRDDGKILPHEAQYERQRFETHGPRPEKEAMREQQESRATTRSLGAVVTDRADLVSQQAAARDRLNQALDRGGAGQGPDQTPDPSRKPPDIER